MAAVRARDTAGAPCGRSLRVPALHRFAAINRADASRSAYKIHVLYGSYGLTNVDEC